MNKLIIAIVFSCCCYVASAQYTVRIVVSGIAAKPRDEIYIAGNFNNWNPADNNYKLKPFAGGRRIIVFSNMDTGHYEFKFTRGSWEKAEATSKAEDISNRTIDVHGDTSIDIAIAGWKDDAPEKPKPNTASINVHIIDTAFYMPQLNRYRRIWIYLPPSYNKMKGKTYPVFLRCFMVSPIPASVNK